MPHRDPETGQFTSGRLESFTDYETASVDAQFQIAAANVDGTTGRFLPDGQEFEGAQIIDFDELVDRNEELHLLRAQHAMTTYVNSTGTEDGTVRAAIEISSAPTRQAVHELTSGGGDASFSDFNVEGDLYRTDTIDVLGRPLVAVGHQPFSDSASGVGGGGSEGRDSVELAGLPEVLARFHPRDELFVNGVLEASNVDDAAIHVDVQLQHLYGVRSQ